MGTIHIKEVENSQFYQFPQWLLKEPYNSLSFKAMVMYMLLWDRRGLSVKNKWHDSDGKVFLYFTNEQFMEKLKLSEPAVISGKKELAEIGLLSEFRQGVNKPNRLYINGTKEVLGQDLKDFKYGTKEVLGQDLKDFKGIKTNNIKTNISRLIEPAAENPVFSKLKEAFGQMSVGATMVEEANEMVKNFGEDLVLHALTETILNNGRSLRYTQSILNSWWGKGYRTVQQVEDAKKAKATNQVSAKQEDDGMDQYRNRTYTAEEMEEVERDLEEIFGKF